MRPRAFSFVLFQSSAIIFCDRSLLSFVVIYARRPLTPRRRRTVGTGTRRFRAAPPRDADKRRVVLSACRVDVRHDPARQLRTPLPQQSEPAPQGAYMIPHWISALEKHFGRLVSPVSASLQSQVTPFPPASTPTRSSIAALSRHC